MAVKITNATRSNTKSEIYEEMVTKLKKKSEAKKRRFQNKKYRELKQI